jgi:myo-inositol-1(or 4)-monophosphatase
MALLKRDAILEEARRIGWEAGNLLLRTYERPFAVSLKGEINLVTEADQKVERFIAESLQKAFPTHGIVAEEGTLVPPKGNFTWMVDPLDGTTNYAHHFPLFSVSLALLEENKPVLGVIVVPLLKEEFYAVKGEGAFLNGKAIHVSEVSDLGKAFLTTGVPYSVRENVDFHLGLYRKFLLRAFAVRRGGSACIDLCYVACGRFDGYWEAGLQPWDAAAGILLVEEAGGKVGDFSGNPYEIKVSQTLLAANKHLFLPMLEAIKHD